MHKRIIICLAFIVFALTAQGQEIQSRISVIVNKVSTQVDKKIFQTLQTSLTNFLNSRRWTNDVFQPGEKIQCNFLLTIDEDKGNNIFKGKLTVQAQNQQIVSLPESAHILTLPKPGKEARIRLGSRIGRTQGIESDREGGTQGQNVGLTPVGEFLGEAQNEDISHAVHCAG